MKHAISLGAGVQSSAMALMAAHGEITPMPDAAIFADTHWEPDAVYGWLDELEKILPFPVIRVQYRDGLKKAQWSSELEVRGRVSDGKMRLEIPVHTMSPRGVKGIMQQRICTVDYKLKPVNTALKRLFGHKKGARLPKEPAITSWVGISTDEAHRMKPAREPWQVKRFPLIEMNLSRGHCLQWMEKHDYPTPPRSSCVVCPFHSDAEWQSLSDKEFDEACQFDEFIRGRDSMDSKLYLHASCVPLREADISTPESAGQLNMFGNECFGMCGV